MPRGGIRPGAGRPSSWASGCGREDTKLIRVPVALVDQLLEIAHVLDAGGRVSIIEPQPLADILSVASGIIGHQVNCQGVMGSGLARQIKDRYPVVYEKYAKLVNDTPDKSSLLGVIQPVRVSDDLFVYNLFGQLRYGRDERHTDYEALRVIAQKLKERQVQIHLPFGLGCGNGGGDWEVVSQIFSDVDVIWIKKE